MKRSRPDAKRERVAHIDQEKSTVDVFEHVIRGVRLNRLRELLRESERQRKHEQGWRNTLGPETIENYGAS